MHNSVITPTCSNSVELLPWQMVTLDVKDTVAKMEAAGYLQPGVLNTMKLSAQILAGGELFGRGLVEAEIRNYRLLGVSRSSANPAPQPRDIGTALVPGVYRGVDGVHFETNGSSLCVLSCLEELQAKIQHYGSLQTLAVPVPSSMKRAGACSNAKVWCR